MQGRDGEARESAGSQAHRAGDAEAERHGQEKERYDARASREVPHRAPGAGGSNERAHAAARLGGKAADVDGAAVEADEPRGKVSGRKPLGRLVAEHDRGRARRVRVEARCGRNRDGRPRSFAPAYPFADPGCGAARRSRCATGAHGCPSSPARRTRSKRGWAPHQGGRNDPRQVRSPNRPRGRCLRPRCLRRVRRVRRSRSSPRSPARRRSAVSALADAPRSSSMPAGRRAVREPGSSSISAQRPQGTKVATTREPSRSASRENVLS